MPTRDNDNGWDEYLVTTYGYDAAGNQNLTTDPRGIQALQVFDALGRVTQTIQNYTGSTTPTTTNAITNYYYDQDGRTRFVQTSSVKIVTDPTVNPSTGVISTTTTQSIVKNTTEYDYQQGVAYSAPYQTIYRTPDTGLATNQAAAKPGDVQKDTYDQLGDVTNEKDRSGAGHVYTYDAMGRELTDTAGAVTSAASGNQDNSVTEREYSYDVFGRIVDAQTLNHTTPTSDDQFVYDGLGNLTDEFQDHSGAIPTGTNYASNSSNVPDVHYNYTNTLVAADDSSGGDASSSVLTSEVYPAGATGGSGNSRILTYNYNGNSGLDASIHRLSSLSDGSGSDSGNPLESYTYLGLNTVVSETLPQINVEMSYRKTDAGSSAPGNPNTGEYDAGPDDPYTGLDRFGRVIDQNWFTIGGATIARDQYAYDADSNILYDNNLGPTSVLQGESELYGANGANAATAYDNLNRVTAFNSGALSTGAGANRANTISTSTRTGSQPAWAMNSQGIYQRSDTGVQAPNNLPVFQGVYSQAQMQTMMLHVPGIPGTSTIGSGVTVSSLAVQFDAWGDLTNQQQWTTTVTAYSALIEHAASSAVSVGYRYDALGNRIAEGNEQLYYDAAGNVIEERSSTGTTAASDEYVWSPAGGNHLVLRDRATGSGGSLGYSASGLGERLYSLHDGQNNVIAIYAVATSSVVERYMYTPGGQVTVLDLNGNVIGNNSLASAYNWRYMYQTARDDGGGIYDLNGTEINSLTGLPLKEDPTAYSASQNAYNDAVVANSEVYVPPAIQWASGIAAGLGTVALFSAGAVIAAPVLAAFAPELMLLGGAYLLGQGYNGYEDAINASKTPSYAIWAGVAHALAFDKIYENYENQGFLNGNNLGMNGYQRGFGLVTSVTQSVGTIFGIAGGLNAASSMIPSGGFLGLALPGGGIFSMPIVVSGSATSFGALGAGGVLAGVGGLGNAFGNPFGNTLFSVGSNGGQAATGPRTDNRYGHNRMIRQVAREVTANGDTVIGGGREFDGVYRPEAIFKTPYGFKSSRRLDLLVLRPDGSVYGINVGRIEVSGLPLLRERLAIQDLNEEIGLEVQFVPYGGSR